MRSILSILALIFCLGAWAQPGQYSSQDSKAIKAYESGLEYYKQVNLALAIDDLQKAVERDPRFIEAHLLLYQAYGEFGNMDAAKSSLQTAVELDDEFFPNANFFLGEMEIRDSEYASAEGHLRRFLALDPHSEKMKEEASRLLANCAFAQESMANPKDFDPKNLGPGINSEFPEYYPCLTTDDATMLFTRLIPDEAGYSGIQEELMISRLDQDAKWGVARGVPPINTSMNEGAATLSPDGQVLIFTACEVFGDFGPGREGMGSCDLFYSLREGNRWSEPRNFGPPINTVHWESQPSMGPDGKTLYFIRGKSGGRAVQDQDIYVSHLQDDGSWGRAIKLPRVINTKYAEESVMIHPDGRTLYFSSEGHVGMGGLDIYVTKLGDDGLWSEPKNLGYPINTGGDENSLLVSSRGDLAYFASDREGGHGELDLYSFVLPLELRPDRVNYIVGTVRDAVTKKPVEAELNFLTLDQGSAIASTYSDRNDGGFLLSLPTVKDVALNVNASGYMFYSANFSREKSNTDEPWRIEVELQPIAAGSKIILENVFFETNKFDLKDESKVELDILVKLMKDEPVVRVEVGGHTDNVGSDADNEVLSANRANSVKTYLTSQGIESSRIETKGYGASEPIDTNDTEEGRARNRRVELKVL